MPDWVVQVLGVLGIGSIGTAVVVAFSNRKKVGAEATEKIVATSGELLEDLRNDRDEARKAERDERQARIKVENRERGWWRRASVHDQWDQHMMRKVEELGGVYSPMPPLFPTDAEVADAARE